MDHHAARRFLALLPLAIIGAGLLLQALWLQWTPGPLDRQGIVRGHDFVHFYALGTAAVRGDPSVLYDEDRLSATMWQAVPASRPDRFPPLYGPQVALALAPLARLPYEAAARTWLVVTLLLYAAAAAGIAWLVPIPPLPRGRLLAVLLASPALGPLIVAGQTSAVALAAVVAAWWALASDRAVLAGLALGVLAYKPSLFGPVVVLLVLARAWPIVAGATMAAVGQLAVGWAWAGTSVMTEYADTLVRLLEAGGLSAGQPQHLHSVFGFVRLLAGPGPRATLAAVAVAAVLLVLGASAWRRGIGAPSRQVAVLALAMVTTAPHLYAYDLVLLAPALVATWAWVESQPVSASRRIILTLTWLASLAPLSGPLAAVTGVQVSTVVLCALLLAVSLPAGLSPPRGQTPSGGQTPPEGQTPTRAS